MTRLRLFIAGVFLALLVVIGGVHLYSLKQANAAIQSVIDQAKGQGVTVSVDAVRIAPFATRIALGGIKAVGGDMQLTVDAATLVPNWGDIVSGKTISLVDLTLDGETVVIKQTLPAVAGATPQTVETTYSIAHQSAVGLDIAALGAAVPSLIHFSQQRPKSLDDFKALDFSPFLALKAQSIHAEHMTVVSKTPTFQLTESVVASDVQGLSNGTIQSQTLDGLSETIALGPDSAVGPVSMTFTLRHSAVAGLTIPASGKDFLSSAGNLFGMTGVTLEDMTFASPNFAMLSTESNPVIKIAKLTFGDVGRDKNTLTAGTFAVDGISIPLSLLATWPPSAIARELGLQSLDVSLSVHSGQDATGQIRELGPISIDAKGLVGISGTMTVSGVGPAVSLETLINHSGAEALRQQWHNAAFNEAVVAFTDHGLIHKLIEARAAASGQKVSDMAATAPMIVGGMLATVVGENNAMGIGTALGGMIGGKTALSFHATTKAPIPFSAFSKLDAQPLPPDALTIVSKAE